MAEDDDLGTIKVGRYAINQHRSDIVLTYPEGGRAVLERGSKYLTELVELARARGYGIHDPDGLLDE